MKKEPTKEELKKWIKNERNVFLNSFFDLLNQRKELENEKITLQKCLDDANKTIQDQELIIKKLKRRRICDNQKTEARKEHINELIEQVKELKEEIARRGRIINELKIQRKEANEVIKDYDGFTAELTPDGKYAFKIANSARLYLEKWGVK